MKFYIGIFLLFLTALASFDSFASDKDFKQDVYKDIAKLTKGYSLLKTICDEKSKTVAHAEKRVYNKNAELLQNGDIEIIFNKDYGKGTDKHMKIIVADGKTKEQKGLRGLWLIMPPKSCFFATMFTGKES
jgi:hypothetical protein